MSDEIKQNQKAGANSQQTQIQNLTIINGIDEKRAREICDEKFDLIRKEFSSEALQIANERVSKFEDLLIPKMKKIDGALEFFSDPSFQYLISNAHRTAATTERLADYELLSELLIHRITKCSDRKTYAGINKAVEIVNQIDEDALCGLTLAYSIGSFFPTSGDIFKGFDILEELYLKLIYMSLPQGSEWLEHLELLSAIKILNLQRFNPFCELFKSIMNGYYCLGIEKNSGDYDRAVQILEDNNLDKTVFLAENPFNTKYYRIPIVNKQTINDLTTNCKSSLDDKIGTLLSENQKSALIIIFDMYKQDALLLNQIKNEIDKIVSTKKSLNHAMHWWNNISFAFSETSVGRVLAHANAQKYDASIPPLKGLS